MHAASGLREAATFHVLFVMTSQRASVNIDRWAKNTAYLACLGSMLILARLLPLPRPFRLTPLPDAADEERPAAQERAAALYGRGRPLRNWAGCRTIPSIRPAKAPPRFDVHPQAW